MLKWTAAVAGASALAALPAQAQTAAAPAPQPTPSAPPRPTPAFGSKMIGFVLAQEQFPVEQLVRLAGQATQAGFPLLATSDHFQPWQANEGNAGQAWITLGAAGAIAGSAWMGTHVTCPTLRYNPAVVAEAFTTLDRLYPGRIFLGVGSGEALNEQAATGQWPKWDERWERLIEAIAIIRALWSGQDVKQTGKYYTVNAKLYEPPKTPIPLLTAANGPKAMEHAGTYGDGLITDPKTWKQYKPRWEKAARAAGKDPSRMPVMIEHFVVVGDQHAARQAAEYWRFLPKAWHNYFDIESPVTINQKADAEVPLEKLIAQWTVGTDAKTHIEGCQKLFDSGVTIINVHSGQPDQAAVIDFYGREVLPHFA
jgi:TAT-translocated FGD2 family F420-dependent dehydrogenase